MCGVMRDKFASVQLRWIAWRTAAVTKDPVATRTQVRGRMVSCRSTVVGFRALAVAGILSMRCLLRRGSEVVLLQGMRVLGLELAGCGEFVPRLFASGRHNIRRRSEQLLTHGVAVEYRHSDGGSWECWQTAFDA